MGNILLLFLPRQAVADRRCHLIQAGEDPKLYLLATAKALLLHPGYNSLQEEASKGIDPIGDHPLGICSLDIFHVMGIGTIFPKKPHGIMMSRPASRVFIRKSTYHSSLQGMSQPRDFKEQKKEKKIPTKIFHLWFILRAPSS